MTHHLPSTVKPLIGKNLGSFKKGDPATLVFTDGSQVIVSVVGDCCSSSYIYDVISEGSPEGTPLLDVIEQDTDSPRPSGEDVYKTVRPDAEGECLSIWDIRFRFEGGSVLVRHVNDSNGYYDGDTRYDIELAEKP